ncbi:MAG TPA: hypothetical protein VKU77_37355 [Streptosporangiaceae bacterium]|nr:hypothetical protein [Streptosporangiaceae bacterium]
MDEDQFRHRGGRPGRGAQLAGRDDQVVDQAGPGDGGQAVQHIGPVQPVRVGFALDLVPQADQLRAARLFLEGGDAIRDVRGGQVGPADHPGEQIAGAGQREQFGVSPGTVTVCTTTLAATPFASVTVWYSPGGKSRRSGATAGPAIQSWSRTPRSHTWW